MNARHCMGEWLADLLQLDRNIGSFCVGRLVGLQLELD